MSNHYEEILFTDTGFITELEQEKLRGITVAIAGMGGVGGLLAERLLRLGVGKLKITDPGAFERSNCNRQFASSMLNLGKNKAEVLYARLKEINPQAQILYSTAGITDENDARQFVSDCALVVDEMDFGAFRESIALQRAARNGGVHYMFASAIGFGALVAIFEPGGVTLEEYNNLPRDIDLNDIGRLTVSLAEITPVIPSYLTAITDTMIQEMMSGRRPTPTTSIGAGLASVLAASESVNLILGKRDVPKAPRYTFIDLVDRLLLVKGR